MKTKQLLSIHLTTLLSVASLFLLAACVTPGGGSSESTEASARSAKSGAQLWAENCSSCHNFRSPGTYSDAQWEIAVDHMRLRASLTGPDSRAILTFLQAGN